MIAVVVVAAYGIHIIRSCIEILRIFADHFEKPIGLIFAYEFEPEIESLEVFVVLSQIKSLADPMLNADLRLLLDNGTRRLIANNRKAPELSAPKVVLAKKQKKTDQI